MSDRSTTRLIDAYLETSSAPLFLGGFFQTPPANIHNTEKIEIDVMRITERACRRVGSGVDAFGVG